MDKQDVYHYYHQNEHGDTELITGVDGKIQNAYSYDAFGNIRTSQELIENRYTYYGEQYDKISEQYYLRARFYNPAIARFTQEDEYRGDGLNLYAYCANNPAMYIDPSGYGKSKSKCKINNDQDNDSNSKGNNKKNGEVGPNSSKKGSQIESSGNINEGGSNTQPDFYVTPDGQVIPTVAYNLPAYDGKTTQGVMVLPDGQQIPLTSGNGDPRYTNYRNNGHVEQKAALYMRENGVDSAIVYHNNTNGTCGYCNTMTGTFLPEGATLTVVPPVDAVANNSRAIDVPKTYIGTNNEPKISPRYKGD